MKIAFLGTGLIGTGMVQAALSRGEQVTVWNRSAAKAQALAAQGAQVAATPAEAVVGADRIHVVLSDDTAVDATLDAAHVPAGALLVDHTTTAPVPTAARAARLTAAGVDFMHCPIFMAPQNARQATGLMLAAGPRKIFDRVQPELAKMTGDVWWLGERPDFAAAYKLFGNAMILSIVGGLADVFTMGAALGISATEAHALFARFKPAFTIDVRGARMARDEFSPASFTMTMARKDVRLMLDTAGDRPLTVLPGLAAAMDRAIAAGLADLDVGALAKR
jgi:3-hydroxyisobutyrate dehydrogenase-like beta-hydroxyacid dehydrogenase